MELESGKFAISKAGHDKGRVYLVLGFEGGRVLVADGKSHPKEAPKKKNAIHLQPMGHGLEAGLLERLRSGEISNEEIGRLVVSRSKK